MIGIDVFHGDGTNSKLPLKPIPQKAYKESDFVIIKATQGVSYKYTEFFHIMLKQALKDNKLVGAYHYAAGNDPVQEADYFIKTIKQYLGKIILCLDWESGQNAKFGSKTWCTKFIDRVKQKTERTCFLYTGLDGCKQNESLAGKVPLWFAGYPKPMRISWDIPIFKYDLGKWKNYTIWQYSSTNEQVDRNTTKLTKSAWKQFTESVQSKDMDTSSDKVIKVAEKEVGYLEKRSNHDLDSKTANAGSGNYTKYGKWIGANGDYWCASFLSWIFYKAYGTTEGKKLLCGAYSPACETIRQNFIKKNQYKYSPQVGDVIFFKGTRHAGANHIGLVIKVADGKVYTIEGNTSGASGVIDNGGGVAKKSYSTKFSKILGYGKPKYSNTQTTNPPKTIKYYPKYEGNSKSLVDALKSVGLSDISFAKREKIADANGITNYSGSATQNTKLLKLLKAGRLKKA